MSIRKSPILRVLRVFYLPKFLEEIPKNFMISYAIFLKFPILTSYVKTG